MRELYTLPSLTPFQVVITDGDLERVDDGINLIVHREKDVLDKCVQNWCYFHTF